ncbi:hypothetical protein VP01_1485g2 [Puccinia sorghi]|uniref:Uncharacterized protein n=1 Tax=Puccinia sorghi TaxID=27349 RepID=A0A0L6VLB7_9BASI|nr:hypothetical protein VP01_1485g2 [Puccinia sorghi]
MTFKGSLTRRNKNVQHCPLTSPFASIKPPQLPHEEMEVQLKFCLGIIWIVSLSSTAAPLNRRSLLGVSWAPIALIPERFTKIRVPAVLDASKACSDLGPATDEFPNSNSMLSRRLFSPKPPSKRLQVELKLPTASTTEEPPVIQSTSWFQPSKYSPRKSAECQDRKLTQLHSQQATDEVPEPSNSDSSNEPERLSLGDRLKNLLKFQPCTRSL